MPSPLSEALTVAEVEALRQRLNLEPLSSTAVQLTRADFVGAAGVFLLVFFSTFPVVVPLIVVRDTQLAVRLSNAVAVSIMFILGWSLGRYAGRPGWRSGARRGNGRAGARRHHDGARRLTPGAQRMMICGSLVDRVVRPGVAPARCRCRDHAGRVPATGRPRRRVARRAAAGSGALLVPVWRAGVLAVLQLAPDGRHRHVGDLAARRRLARRDRRRRPRAPRGARRRHGPARRGDRVCGLRGPRGRHRQFLL